MVRRERPRGAPAADATAVENSAAHGRERDRDAGALVDDDVKMVDHEEIELAFSTKVTE